MLPSFLPMTRIVGTVLVKRLFQNNPEQTLVSAILHCLEQDISKN
jgi:hypothetical protein